MTRDSSSPIGNPATISVAVVFFIFAVAAVVIGLPFKPPLGEPVAVDAKATDPTPVRAPQLQPIYKTGAYTYRCSDCHKIIPSPGETDRPLTQHRDIRLQHGVNTRCFNCHHRTNRDAFVDDYGREIPWDQPQLLCQKCHGLVYRDWEHGAHGRTNGYWNKAQGPQTRRRCIECHDPHCPPFAAMAPAPGPRTLRMGLQEFGPRHEGHDPLRLGGHARPAAAPREHGKD
jgi:DNA-directed RNA polymerase subunit RPC12/RpoP